MPDQDVNNTPDSSVNNDIGNQALLNQLDQSQNKAANTATNPVSMLQGSSGTADVMSSYDLSAGKENQKKSDKSSSLDTLKDVAKVAVLFA